MTHRSNTVRNEPIVSDETIRGTMRRQINQAINIAPRRFTRQTLAQESGVNVHTIDSILSRDEAKHRRIALADALSIASVLGERAVNAILADIGFVARPLDEAGDACPMQMTATAMQHLSVIATAAADGRIDHVERPVVQEAADMLIATVLPVSSHGGAA
ncbi:MAG: hypothetical protein AB7E60_02845 [Sphingobium sp.]